MKDLVIDALIAVTLIVTAINTAHEIAGWLF